MTRFDYLIAHANGMHYIAVRDSDLQAQWVQGRHNATRLDSGALDTFLNDTVQQLGVEPRDLHVVLERRPNRPTAAPGGRFHD